MTNPSPINTKSECLITTESTGPGTLRRRVTVDFQQLSFKRLHTLSQCVSKDAETEASWQTFSERMKSDLHTQIVGPEHCTSVSVGIRPLTIELIITADRVSDAINAIIEFLDAYGVDCGLAHQ